MDKPALLGKIADAIQQHEGWYPGSRSFRNSNPGNLKFVQQPGNIGQDPDHFAIFPNYATGRAALIRDITIKIDRGTDITGTKPITTLRELFHVYAPKEDQNDPNNYAVVVANACQVSPDAKFGAIFNAIVSKVIRIALVANNCEWATLGSQVKELQAWFSEASGGKLLLEIDTQYTQYDQIPFLPYAGYAYMQGVDPSWYDAHISGRGKGYHAVLFLMNTWQWRGQGARGWRTDADEGQVELQIAADETEKIGYNFNGTIWETTAFVNYARHEIMHALFMMQGWLLDPSRDATHTAGIDPTHYFYNQGKLEYALTDIDYGKLDNLLHPFQGFHHQFQMDLVQGMSNGEVTFLQQALMREGLFSVDPTGYYGPVTAKAVHLFQKKYGIATFLELYVYPSTRYGRRVGPKTRAKLNQLYA